MNKSIFVSNSLGVAVASSEQLTPRLAIEYICEEKHESRYEEDQRDR